MPVNPDFKIKITRDEQDVQKVIKDAGRIAETVAHYQKQIEERGSIFPGSEKEYQKSLQQLNKYYQDMSRFQRKFDKEKSQAQKKYYDQARNIVDSHEKLEGVDRVQKIQQVAQKMFEKTALGGPDMQRQMGMFSQGISRMQELMKTGTGAAAGGGGGGFVSGLGGIGQMMYGGGVSPGSMIMRPGMLKAAAGKIGISGAAGATGLGTLLALLYKVNQGRDVYKEFQGDYEQQVRFAAGIESGELYNQIRSLQLGGYATTQEALGAFSGMYEQGIMPGRAAGAFQMPIEMARAGWGEIPQMAQFMGQMGYMGGRGANLGALKGQMQAYRRMTGYASAQQLMPMMSQYAGMVSQSTGSQVDLNQMMSFMQSMGQTGLRQGYGQLGLQTMSGYHRAVSTGLGRDMLMREYAGMRTDSGSRRFSYAQILDKLEKGIGDPENVKTMRRIVERASGGDTERQDILYRQYFGLNRGQIDQLRKLGSFGATPSQEGVGGIMKKWGESFSGIQKGMEQLGQFTDLDAGELAARAEMGIKGKIVRGVSGGALTAEEMKQRDKEEFRQQMQKAMEESQRELNINASGNTVIRAANVQLHVAGGIAKELLSAPAKLSKYLTKE